MNVFKFLEFIMLERFYTNIDVVIVKFSVTEDDRTAAGTFPKYVKDFD